MIRVHEKHTQCGKLLRHFKRHGRLTTLQATLNLKITTLSQRCGELRRMGWPVSGKWLTLLSGARVKSYGLDK